MKSWTWNRRRAAALGVVLSSLAISLIGAGCRKPAPTGAPSGPPAKGAFAIQVVAVETRLKPISESVGLVGSITANEFVQVKAEMDGTIKEVAFNEGQRVEKGQLLIAIDESRLETALNQAEANLKLSGATYERTRRLLGEKLVAPQEHDQAVATHAVNEATVALMRRNLKDARIVAPFTGIVGAREVSPGQVISQNTILTSLVDLDTVKVEVQVPERYLSQLQIGQPLKFTVAAFPGSVFEGSVYFISPQLDAGTRTALVKAKVPNDQGKLRGGMFASLELSLRLRDSALVIPEPALISNGDKVSVFVVDQEAKAQMRPVTVGLRLAGQAEILKGLAAGDKVVVEGIQKLAPGMPVKMAPPEAALPYQKD